MPPIIKKQIKKTQKADSVSGYIKIIPLSFFVGFLILGWLISRSALKFFGPDPSGGNLCVSQISTVFAGEGCEGCDGCDDGSGSCEGCEGCDGCDDGSGSCEGCSGGDDGSGSCEGCACAGASCEAGGCAGGGDCGNDGGCGGCEGDGGGCESSCSCSSVINWPCGNVNPPACP